MQLAATIDSDSFAYVNVNSWRTVYNLVVALSLSIFLQILNRRKIVRNANCSADSLLDVRC